MTDQSDLWAAVVASYDSAGLVTLTNIRDRSATTVDTTVGTDAALGVINFWPAFAEVAYDASDALHVEVAKMGVIALLWRRGGSATQIAKIEWDEVFSPEGLIAQVRKTNPRSHRGPSSNSGVTQKAETTSSGENVRGWSDPDALPQGRAYMPRRVNAGD